MTLTAWSGWVGIILRSFSAPHWLRSLVDSSSQATGHRGPWPCPSAGLQQPRDPQAVQPTTRKACPPGDWQSPHEEWPHSQPGQGPPPATSTPTAVSPATQEDTRSPCGGTIRAYSSGDQRGECCSKGDLLQKAIFPRLEKVETNTEKWAKWEDRGIYSKWKNKT